MDREFLQGLIDEGKTFTKSFTIAGAGMTRSSARARAEVEKCVLLCANCHAEVEVGAREVPSPDTSGSAAVVDPR